MCTKFLKRGHFLSHLLISYNYLLIYCICIGLERPIRLREHTEIKCTKILSLNRGEAVRWSLDYYVSCHRKGKGYGWNFSNSV